MIDPSLNPVAILASLGISDVTEIIPVTGGSDTAIWRVLWQDQPYALRMFRAEQQPVFEREIAVMQMAAAGGVIVPAIIRQGMWERRPVLLLSWIAGKTLAAQLMAQPLSGWNAGKAFGAMQAKIHQIKPPSQDDPTDWIEWAGDEPELKVRLYDLKSRQTALLHLDYHPLNVMVVDGSQISGVLDWANARMGDPRADFARTYTILRVEPYSPTGDSLQLALLRRVLESAWRTGYIKIAGNGALKEMALFYAWAGAVMICDLSPKIGRAGHWLKDQHLDQVRRWRDHWKRQAGIKV
ncbi:MAG TPA: aminoglycoside phosphotransferase family protein [Phototrophicaceae bacterium]|jgi:aminoglycoside phosphotransferase (APT) family kinase protein|nr:aminoglycoside phosphotransferase family protein [Phototrophicaceae bacterium]